ncbi:formyl transferase [Desulfobacula sp.]|uniref:formyl transferase n=1 Tax=Desulfobacula sp. TaxID=2593537 RepID=UPI002621277C|nr:formyl transferase [Desulfobacula sp.]
MSNLSMIILCGSSPRHIHVANRLCKAAKPLAIIQEAGGEQRGKKLQKLLKNPPLLKNKVWRWIRDRKRYAGGKEARFFFGNHKPELDRPDLLINVPHINHSDVLEIADRLQPDVIAVFGTSLIKGELLNRGRLGIVNLHGGLSPFYRGADCTFWALYNREPDQVGCTLHFIDPGIDTGNLIAHVCPEVKEEDDELTLFWRAIWESAEVYAELFDRLEKGERFGEVQSNKGRLYQVKDREFVHEKELDEFMRQGVLKGLDLPLRVKWFNRLK